MWGLTTAAVVARTLEARVRESLGLSARPYKVLLELTLDCNSRCGTCAIWKTPTKIKKQQLSLNEIKDFFRTSGRDIIWLALSGGEITLHSQFPAIIAAAKQYCPSLRLVTFTTNGLLPRKALEYAECIRGIGIESFITISLDGDAEVHDRIRGVPGNHALAWETYELLRRNGIRVHFGLTIGNENGTFIAREYRRLRGKIKAITIVHGGGIYGQRNAQDDETIARSLEVVDANYEITGLGDLIERMYVRLSLSFVRAQRSTNAVPCSVGHTSLHVKPDGTASLCMFMPDIGNVRSGASLRELVNSQRSLEMLREIKKDNCPHCWMNCYAPHSIMYSPLRSIRQLFLGHPRRKTAPRAPYLPPGTVTPSTRPHKSLPLVAKDGPVEAASAAEPGRLHGPARHNGTPAPCAPVPLAGRSVPDRRSTPL